MTLAELLPKIEERARQQADGSDAVWNVLARDVLTLLPAARLALDMGEALRAGPKCPVHGIPDCSPLLNGCSLPNQIAALLARLDGIANKDKTT